MRALEFGEINELAKIARTRYSEVVSVAIGEVSEDLTPLPPQIEGWRTWGAQVSRVNADGRKGE